MRSQRAPRALALAILLTCALLARAADEGTALDRELYDVCRQKTPLVPLREAEAAAEDAVLREAEDALKDEV